MARTIQLTYNQSTGVLTSDATSAIDIFSTTFQITPISGAVMDLVAEMSVTVGGVKISNPFARFESGECMMPVYVAKACNGSIELSLRITYDTGIIENSSQIILDTVYAPDVMATAGDVDLILMRNSSWEYVSTWNYAKGSIVLYNDMLYTSLKDDNKGNTPSTDSAYWTPSVDASQISITIDDTVTSTSSHAVRSSGIASYVDGKVSAVDAKIPENPASISNVNDAFEAEKTSRELADSGLSTLISSERTRALEAETTLQANIDAKTISLDTEVTTTSQNGVTSAGIASYVSGQMTNVVKTVDGKIPDSVIPSLAISEYKGTVSSVSDLTSLSAEQGDYAIVSNDGTYIKDTSGWIKISTPATEIAWGKITGTIASQTDLTNAIATAKSEAEGYADGKFQLKGTYATPTDVSTAKSEAISTAESDAESKYQPKMTAGTDYVVPSAIADMETKTHASSTYQTKLTADTDYLTPATAEATYAKKGSTAGVTKEEGDTYWAPIGSDYAYKTDISDMLTKTLASTTYEPILSDAQHNAVNSGITASKVSTYDGYATAIAGKQDKGDYALKSDIPTDYLTSTDKSDLEGKITTAVSTAKSYTDTEIGGLSSTYLKIEDAGTTYATKSDAQGYATTAGANALADAKSYVDGKGYAKATDVAGTYATKSDLKAVTDDYLTSADKTTIEGEISTATADMLTKTLASTTYATQTALKAVTDDYLTSSDKTTIEADISNAKDGAVSTAESYTDGQVSTAKSEANTYTDGAISTLHTTVSGEIATAVSSTYKVKGSCAYADLPTDAKVGDVWNITDSFVVETITYPAGTNVVWTDSGWDILAGTYDLSVYTKTADLPTTVIASTEPTQVVGSVWIDTSED